MKLLNDYKTIFFCTGVVCFFCLLIIVFAFRLDWNYVEEYWLNRYVEIIRGGAVGAMGPGIILVFLHTRAELKAKRRHQKTPHDNDFKFRMFFLSLSLLSSIWVLINGFRLQGRYVEEPYLNKYVVFILIAAIVVMVCDTFVFASQIRKRKLAGKPEDGSGRITQGS